MEPWRSGTGLNGVSGERRRFRGLTGKGYGEGGCDPPQKILGFFHLKWLILVQIQLYFNRNVRQFTAIGPQQLHVYMYCWRLRGGFDRTSRTPSLRACLQHSIGYMGDGFYRSKDPTNSIKVLKEKAAKENNTKKHKENRKYTHKKYTNNRYTNKHSKSPSLQ